MLAVPKSEGRLPLFKAPHHRSTCSKSVREKQKKESEKERMGERKSVRERGAPRAHVSSDLILRQTHEVAGKARVYLFTATFSFPSSEMTEERKRAHTKQSKTSAWKPSAQR